VFGYKVEIDSVCTHYEREDVEWGSWSSEHSNYFKEVLKVDKNSYPDITSSVDIKEGEECFVVLAEWSSGDSFGCGYRSNTEPLAIFKDAESAQAFKTACEKVKDYSVELATPDGQNFDIFAGWVGYFERLDEIHVEQTKLKYRFQ
jgi:hypothetical protein